MVTAELAVALPALVVVLAMVLGALALGVDQIRCVDGARLAARSLARGDGAAHATELARQAAPGGASVSVLERGQVVTVVVLVRRDLPLLGRGVDLRATSVADLESAAPAGVSR